MSAKAAVQNDSAPKYLPYVADDRCVSSVKGAGLGGRLRAARFRESCSRYKVSRFSACLLIDSSGDEGINQRITNLLPSVRQRSCRSDDAIFTRMKVVFSSSLFVYGCRCWGQTWGQKQPDTLISHGSYTRVTVNWSTAVVHPRMRGDDVIARLLAAGAEPVTRTRRLTRDRSITA